MQNSNSLLLQEDNFIGISGLIGAGKTTLATELGKIMNLPVYFEPVIENEYLEDFYRDPKRYSFSLQIYLLNTRFRQHQQILWNGKGGIQDRTLYEVLLLIYSHFLIIFVLLCRILFSPKCCSKMETWMRESTRRT